MFKLSASVSNPIHFSPFAADCPSCPEGGHRIRALIGDGQKLYWQHHHGGSRNPMAAATELQRTCCHWNSSVGSFSSPVATNCSISVCEEVYFAFRWTLIPKYKPNIFRAFLKKEEKNYFNVIIQLKSILAHKNMPKEYLLLTVLDKSFSLFLNVMMYDYGW